MGNSAGCCGDDDVRGPGGADGLVSSHPVMRQIDDEEVVSHGAVASNAGGKNAATSPSSGKGVASSQLSDMGQRLLNQRYPSGRRVIVANRRGRVRFVGTCKFAPGNWIGVELDEAFGKNDGVVQGVAYFTCEANHGVFVRPANVELAEEEPTALVAAPREEQLQEEESAGPQSTVTADQESRKADEVEGEPEWDLDGQSGCADDFPREEPQDLELLKEELNAAGAEAVAPPAAEKDGGFYISLDKGSGPTRRKLGLDATATKNAPYLKVLRVRPDGLIHEWNLANPDRQVKAGHIIVEINGVRGDKDLLYDLVGSEQQMKVRIEELPPT